jgi:hypothetical protein
MAYPDGTQLPPGGKYERTAESSQRPLGAWPQEFVGMQQLPTEELIRSNFEMRLSALEERVRKISELGIGFIKINLLPNKTLNAPLDAIVEPDGDGFTARTIDLPLYGHGDDPKESIEMLKREIESLYDDLIEDDNFSDEWLRIRRFLVERITE